MPDAVPVVVKRFRRRLLLGLVRIEYRVEDRRPDLTAYRTKYKHYLTVTVVGREYHWLFHTEHAHDQLPYVDHAPTPNGEVP